VCVCLSVCVPHSPPCIGLMDKTCSADPTQESQEKGVAGVLRGIHGNVY
jgi:hypothetical protein